MKLCRLLLAVALSLLLLSSCSSSGLQSGILQIYALDVGQGDALLLRSAEGDILIDAGPEQSQELLCLRLEQLGVSEIALAVFTHPDEDHVGGADGVLSSFSVSEVWINGAESEELCYLALMEAIEQSGTSLKIARAGDTYFLGGLSLLVLSPEVGDIEGGNADSLSIKLTFGEIRAILTGDADAKGEAAMLSRYGAAQLDCEIYKVGHHGSNTSSSEEFLTAMSPDYALISAGRGNPYGHPHGQVLGRLEEVGAQILRVDLLGEILLETDGKTVINQTN